MVEAYLVAAAALDPRLDALVSLIVFDGLKLGEALALDVEDVRGRPPKVALVVRRQGSVRRIQLTARSARAVHRCAGRREGEPLFTAARSGSPPHRLTRFGADHLLKKVDAAGAASLTANALRRFHVTAHHATGADLDAVRERAGVDDVRTVRRYLAQEAAEIDSSERALRRRIGDGDGESPVG
jgi:integrase